MTTKNILVVDDEAGIRELLSEILFDEGYGVMLAENAAQANLQLEQHSPDIILLDIWMPDIDGLSLLKEWVAKDRMSVPVIMMSGHGTIETALEATRIGAVDFLEKPIALKKLLSTIERVLRNIPVPISEQLEIPESNPTLTNHESGFNLDMPFRQARECFDALYLSYHVNKAAGNIAEVADKIGIERTHLYRKLKQLGIKPSKKGNEGRQ